MPDNPSIAIVGAACRYPDADSPEQLWEMVLARRQAFRPIPKTRLNLDDYHGEGPGEAADPDTTYGRFAAVIDGWRFDRARYRIPGSTYRVTDLTHWLALEVAVRTLESAGYPDAAGLDRDRVGVVIGNTLTGEFSRAALMRLRWPYVRRVLAAAMAAEHVPQSDQDRLMARIERGYKEPFPAPTTDSLAGGLANTLAGRICNHLDLHGGGYTVDGACASSLLAVCVACGALLDGELDVALAGGVDLSLDPFELVGFARVGALSRDQMRVYDSEPTGFLPGEGCGMVALMRAEDAAAVGRPVLAYIRGWGVSSDGQGGLTRPERAGQLLALRRAYRRAGFGPDTVALFEGHGTGTPVGDQVEVEALIEAHRGLRRSVPAALGSVKANIGHTKAAAGIAGLLKAVLAVRHQVIPPTTGCERPLDVLTDPGSPLRVTDARPWPDLPLRAGVSAMGFGGINTHVVIEAPGRRRSSALSTRERVASAAPLGTETFGFSARTARDLEDILAHVAGLAPAMSFADHVDLAATLAAPAVPDSKPYRLAIVAANPGQLAQRAARALPLCHVLGQQPERTLLTPAPGVFAGRGRPGGVGLLFTGQGAPVPSRPGALGRLLPEAGRYFTVAADVTDTALAQPAIIGASIAGLRWLDRLGLRAQGAAGHSLGEITALHWAGVLDEPCVRALAAERGQIMSRLGGHGTGMVSVLTSPDLAAELIAGTSLVIAADNGTAQVVAGPAADLDIVEQRARQRGIDAQRLRVSHGFHSPAVAAARPDLAVWLDGLPFRPLAAAVYSTVYGRRLLPSDDLREMLVEQLTAPVRFREAAAALAADSAVLVEVGPGHGLAAMARAVAGTPTVALNVGAEDAVDACQVAAALFAVGAIPTLRPMFTHRFHRWFDPRHEFEFLANPCESAPARTGQQAVAALRARPGAHRSGGQAPEVAASTTGAGPAVWRLVADAVELPAEEILDSDRLLSDLHLNSLQVVQIAARAAAMCGRVIQGTPAIADVTVSGLVAFIETLPPAGSPGQSAAAAGVADWHRILVRETRPGRARVNAGYSPRCWQLHGTSPLRGLVEQLLPTAPGEPPAIAVFLGEDPGEDEIGTLVAATRQSVATAVPLTVIDDGDTVSGFLATVAQEHPELAIRLVRVAAECPRTARVAAAIAAVASAASTGFSELVFGAGGLAGAPAYLPLQLPAVTAPALAPGDVVLVTGGGRGIGFETALALGHRPGVRVALLGRGDPGRDDELRANLQRLTGAGIRFRYEQADVQDRAAVGAAMARIVGALGPVTALIHASGVNRPARFADLADADFAEHAAPKQLGLQVVLDSLDTGKLRILLTYGSVIGRFGLAGEAHYALANGRMRERARRMAAELPGCWMCDVDWTAWSGTGMGERLGVLDELARAGVCPLPADRGVQLLLKLLDARPGVSSVLITGRLPQLDQARGQPAGNGRFLQRTVVHIPGVELIAETDLGLQTDPQLADHRVSGMAVLPAVYALEAMAQAASALTGQPVTHLAGGNFEQPVTVPDSGTRTIRVCALRREDGDVDVVLRSDETLFSVDHFRCLATARTALVPDVAARRTEQPAHEPAQLYGPLFFHGPAFQRLRRYEHLEATGCTAVLAGARETSGSAGGVQLGELARNDASIHVLQACVPHRRLLPVGCDSFTVHADSSDDLVLAAAERTHTGHDYTYDIVVRDLAGRPVLSWSGLRLRDVGPITPAAPWPRVLLGPYLQRSVAGLLPASRVNGESYHWEPVASDDRRSTLRGLLPWTGEPDQLGRITGEPDGHVLTRLWAALQCLQKAGRPQPGPLVVRGIYEQGWVLLRIGEDDIASVVLRVDGEPDPVAVAVLAKEKS